MTVADLIKQLQAMDPNKEVLSSDFEGWHYSIGSTVRLGWVASGREVEDDDPDAEECVILTAI